MTTINRKRRRSLSSENNCTIQSKYFINQQLVNLNDENKMKEIHEKTINLLFEAANKIHDNIRKVPEKQNGFMSVKLNGSGKFAFIGPKPNNLPGTPDRTCVCCTKNAIIHLECTNCNLELCENCGYSCDICNEFVCHTCVNLFNCGTMDNPCCHRCKIYLK